MASLTPRVLSKLLENTGNKNFKVIREHCPPLLQVIEIFPSHNNDPFRSKGFFLKFFDSRHSAYVSISPQDVDLIFFFQLCMPLGETVPPIQNSNYGYRSKNL